jgi:hypothetical protein
MRASLMPRAQAQARAVRAQARAVQAQAQAGQASASASAPVSSALSSSGPACPLWESQFWNEFHYNFYC